jgi:tripartite-type tricarboxylate transporter receptor subunit TctC
MRFPACFLFAVAVLFSGWTEAATAATGSGHAYPERPVRFIVPFAPGGTTDVIARIVGERLSTRLGQPFVVDNRAGANSVIGCEIVARAAPDGHTVIIVAAGFAVNATLARSLPFDTLRDFAPIGTVAGGPYLMVVHASIPAKTVGEFTAWAKSRSAPVNYASTGIGSPPHLAAELFRLAAGLEMQHVPYKGGGAALPDLLAGRVSMFFGSISTLRVPVQGGKLRAIAVTTLTRAPAMPEVPTFAESGLSAVEVNGWYGLLAPARTPRAAIAALNTALRQSLDETDTRARFATNGLDPMASSPEEFGALIRSEVAKWGKVIRAAGIKPE